MRSTAPVGMLQARMNAAFLRRYRLEAWEDQGHCCKYCHAPLPTALVTADHRVPRSRGGTNMRRNIDALCRECNSAKGSMSAGAFAKAIRDPSGHALHMKLAWARRRIWIAAHRACRNIARSAGLANETPIGQRG